MLEEQARRNRRMGRENSVKAFFHQMVCSITEVELMAWVTGLYLPTLNAVLETPAIKALVEEDTDSITQEHWDAASQAVRPLILHQWESVIRPMAELLGSQLGTTFRELGLDGDGPDSLEARITTEKDVLLSPCAAWICSDPVFQTEEIMWFPAALKHHFMHSGLPGQQFNSIRPFRPEGQRLLERLVQDLGLDPTLDGGSWPSTSPRELMCLRCDARLTRAHNFEELVRYLSS